MARFPFPIPVGWFHVAFDADIEPASIHPMNLFGRELALWRAEDGELCLQDRYCPHLGGNFAVGGQVVGQTLECPFHKWRFATDGQVAEIPYAKKLNRSACVRYRTLVDVCLLTSSAPIDEETVVQHFHVSYRNPEDDARIHRIGQAFDAEVNRQFREDIAIWESKIYQPDPQLCDGDGPVGKYRNWAKQFYFEAV
ncbi:MAG: Rieske 2Fe-2S domain-containing protein [Gammaproteobacteria bacterium]|nr:Rieske 2Fe-2S domain-containing protein [Gammaproteobacteria bacterium]MYK84262.1 Rieske 2Fe-2S domain-containing protein [Gammaproteobacteria bacterium]